MAAKDSSWSGAGHGERGPTSVGAAEPDRPHSRIHACSLPHQPRARWVGSFARHGSLGSATIERCDDQWPNSAAHSVPLEGPSARLSSLPWHQLQSPIEPRGPVDPPIESRGPVDPQKDHPVPSTPSICFAKVLSSARQSAVTKDELLASFPR